MKAIAIGSLLLGGLAIAGAQGIVPMAPKKGIWSLDFSFQYFKPQNGTSTTSFQAMPTYFFTDNIEFGVGVGITQVGSNNSTFANVLGRFYFSGQSTSLIKPFVGAFFQTSHATGGSTGTLWGAQIGAHFFVANNVAVTGTLDWEQFHVSGASNVSEIQANLGFTIFFQGSK